MSILIRIAPGELTANELLSDSTTLVKDWSRTTDMLNTSYLWSASQPEKGLQAEVVTSLGLGGGGYYGSYSGVISFFVATPQMRQYIFQTLMNYSPNAIVTAFLHVPNWGGDASYDFNEFEVVTGELISPIASNADTDYTRFNDKLYHTLQFRFQRGEVVDFTLLVDENNAYLVDENGVYLSLEE